MSIFYRARFDGGKTGFSVLVKADSIAQARAGVAKAVITVDRATDSEIFEAGRAGESIIDLTSENPTDAAQQSLPVDDGETNSVTQPATETAAQGAQAGQPAWLAHELSGNPVAQNTGD